MDSTVLIHEATFHSDLAENAHRHLHSTHFDAWAVGRECRAEFVALTHFSQRDPKAIGWRPEELGLEKEGLAAARARVVIAFDHLRAALSDFAGLPLVTNTINGMFREDKNENS